MARTWTTALVAVLTTGAVVAAGPSARADGASGVLNIAHRGASDRAPEHTLAALAQAVADRSDRLSIDVRLTRDGVPVVLHDDDLARTTDVEQRFPRARSRSVRGFTWAQVRTLDAGSWFGDGTFTGSRVLTLDRVLTELGPSPVGLTVEAKNPQDADGVEGVGAAIVAALRRHPEWSRPLPDGSPRLVLESFRWVFLDNMHAAYPRLPLVLLGERVAAADMDAHPYVTEIDVGEASLTPALVRAAHRRGLTVGAWTVNGRPAISRVLTSEVDAVTSDEPDQVRSVLSEIQRVWSGIRWAPVPAVGRVEVRSAATARLGGRLTVRARVLDAAGRTARWHRVRFQALIRGRWTIVARRVTGSAGTADVSLPVTRSMRVRAVAGRTGSRSVAPTVSR
jgi:glycerophosphoryl diester phosphodiesterase